MRFGKKLAAHLVTAIQHEQRNSANGQSSEERQPRKEIQYRSHIIQHDCNCSGRPKCLVGKVVSEINHRIQGDSAMSGMLSPTRRKRTPMNKKFRTMAEMTITRVVGSKGVSMSLFGTLGPLSASWKSLKATKQSMKQPGIW